MASISLYSFKGVKQVSFSAADVGDSIDTSPLGALSTCRVEASLPPAGDSAEEASGLDAGGSAADRVVNPHRFRFGVGVTTDTAFST